MPRYLPNVLILQIVVVLLLHQSNGGLIPSEDDDSLTESEEHELGLVLRLLTERTKKELHEIEQENGPPDGEAKLLLHKLSERRQQRRNDEAKRTNEAKAKLDHALQKKGNVENVGGDKEDVDSNKKTEGKAIIDTENIDPDSDLEVEIEAMGVERNGKLYHPNGVHPKDRHKGFKETLQFTEQQKIELGIEDVQPGHKVKRNFARGASKWPKGIVPYEIDEPLANVTGAKETIQKAIEDFNKYTCIRFMPRSEELAAQVGHDTYIRFSRGGGCSASVGWTRSKAQWLSLGPGCLYVYIVVHEMGHAIGMHHEQSRSDRDKYVRINWDNLKNGKNNYNLAKLSTMDLNAYDYESVMHYGLWDFSANGGQVIEFLDKELEFLARSANTLEYYDIEDINLRYECADHCKTNLKCENGGFENFECKCFCPNGIIGDLCDAVETDPGCGGIVDVNLAEDKYITTPNYPNNYNTGAVCRWLVRVPVGWYVRATVEQLHLTDDGMALNRCYHWLEIQYHLLGEKGIKRCGDMTGHTYITTRAGNSNMMLLTFNSKMVQDAMARKGFKIKLNAVGRGCYNDPCVYGACRESDMDCEYICTCDPGFNGTNCDTLMEDSDIECSFDYNSKCFLKNTDDDDFQWAINSIWFPEHLYLKQMKIDSIVEKFECDPIIKTILEELRTVGMTSSQRTGPNRAYRGINYIYAEMSTPRKLGDRAVLESSVKLPERDHCFTFYYNMYGGNVGSLNVYIGYNTTKANIWSRSGNQGSGWIKATMNVPYISNLKISIEAVRGADWDGDIALDEIKLSPGFCPIGPPECLTSAKGKDYVGFVNVTSSGKSCQRWDSQSPHSHSYDSWASEDNYCRNFDVGENGPWCYTTDPNNRWQFCNIPYCHYEECLRSSVGYEYKGKVDRTKDNTKCQRWDSQTPHKHSISSLDDQENYCRNPDKEPKPWCYTTDPDNRFNYCNIPKCEHKAEECLRTARGIDYFGNVSTTLSGKTCQRWGSQEPHGHSLGFIGDQENYCRNPDNEPKPWCYTTDPDKRWEFCNIPYCEDLPCKSHPCKNGGTCSNEETTYSCKCFTGFSGQNCEHEYEEDCRRSAKGWDYKGTTNITQSGKVCQRWDSDTPHSHSFHRINDQENYCRNPNPNDDDMPWCYTTDSNKRWEYCNISICQLQNPSCFASSRGEDYFGTMSTTESGETCQRWDSQSPHTHSYGYLSDQENYCRNPFGDEPRPWCYTSDPDARWNFCPVPACGIEAVGSFSQDV